VIRVDWCAVSRLDEDNDADDSARRVYRLRDMHQRGDVRADDGHAEQATIAGWCA